MENTTALRIDSYIHSVKKFYEIYEECIDINKIITEKDKGLIHTFKRKLGLFISEKTTPSGESDIFAIFEDIKNLVHKEQEFASRIKETFSFAEEFKTHFGKFESELDELAELTPFELKEICEAFEEKIKLKAVRIFSQRIAEEIFNPDFFKELHLSVITGEYIRKRKDFEESIKEIQGLFKRGFDANNKALELEFTDLQKCLRLFFDAYKHFVTVEYSKLDNWDKTLLHESFKPNISNRLIEKYSDSIYEAFEVFREYALGLAYIDHNFAAQKDIKARLGEIQRNLQEHRKMQPNAFFELHAEKCSFLLYKLFFRDAGSAEPYLVINSEFESLSQSKISSNKYEDYLKILNYLRNNDPKGFKNDVVKIENKDVIEWNVADYFLLANYFKRQTDECSSSEILHKLKKLTEKFEINQYLKNISSDENFDNAAIKISYQYLKNAELKCFLSHEKQNAYNDNYISDCERYYRDFETIQSNDKIFNYFPFYILSKGLCEYYSHKEFSEADLSFLEKCIRKFEENYKWCLNHHYIAYQLPLTESTIEIYDYKVFTASSFVRAIDYDAVGKQLTEIQTQYKHIKANINYSAIQARQKFETDKKLKEIKEDSANIDAKIVKIEKSSELKIEKIINRVKQKSEEIEKFLDKNLENIDKKVEKIDTQTTNKVNSADDRIREIDRDVKNSTRRHVEILAIFAAIVVFASNSVQIFNKIQTLGGALSFMLIFAIALCFFIALIWLIVNNVYPLKVEKKDSDTQKDDNVNVRKFICRFCWVLLAGLVICCSTMLWFGEHKINEPKENTKTVIDLKDAFNKSEQQRLLQDSVIKQLNLKVDSLLNKDKDIDNNIITN